MRKHSPLFRTTLALLALTIASSAGAVMRQGGDDSGGDPGTGGGSTGTGGSSSGITWVPAPPSATFSGPYLVETWEIDEASANPGQCGGAAGTQAVALGNWTLPIRIDTDDRSGGCRLRYFIYDPQNRLAASGMSVGLTGDPGQCGGSGSVYTLQKLATLDAGTIANLPYHRIDTDSRPGGCLMQFTLSGAPSDPQPKHLEVQYSFDGDANQCGNFGSRSADSRFSPSLIQLGLDTDGRGGGCLLSMRFSAAGL